MEILITYKSKYGSSKKYALWLAEKLKCKTAELTMISKKNLKKYDLIIHGGGLYGGIISGLKFYRKNIKYIERNNKKLIIFATGTSIEGQKTEEEIKKHNFTGRLKNIPLFYCRGNYDYMNLTLLDKTVIQMMNKMIKQQSKKGKLEKDTLEFRKAIFSKLENTDKKYLEPITEYVKNMENKS